MNSLESFRKPPSNKTMGIEIEALFPDGKTPANQQFHGFFYATTDGSIDSYHFHTDTEYYWNGRELVSQPLTTEWLKREINKINKKFPWKYNGSCGIHIHVSRKWCSEKKARAIYAFLCKLSTEDLMLLFGRGNNQYSRYGVEFGHVRYCAVNILPEKTIEFRMFSGGSAKWACYCVDMVKYLVENWSTLNIDAIMAFRALYPDHM